MSRTKRVSLLILLLLFLQQAFAQINITINPINPLQAKVSDLFKGGLTNSGSRTERLYLVGTIVNTTTGQKVASAKTISKEYAVGYELFNEAVLSPEYSFFSTSVEQTGVLPFGNYEYCLKAYLETNNEEAGSACVDVQITPMSPPLLISPPNGSEINTPNPLLIWLGPTPINPSINVVYDLKLVELMQNQTSYDAIQRNFSLLDQSGIPSTNLQYPANATQLEEGKTYAWKILARTGDGNMIGETEVWTFKLNMTQPKPETEKPASMNYVIMKTQLDADYMMITKELKVVYDQTAIDSITFSIRNYDQKGVIDIPQTNINATGENKYIINLEDNNIELRKGNFYILEGQNSKGTKRYILFKYL